MAISSSCNGRGKDFGCTDSHTAPLEQLCFPTPAAPKLHHENSWRHEPGSSSQVPIPPLSPWMDTLSPRSPFSGSCQTESVRKHQQVMGTIWLGQPARRVGKGFLLLLYQVSQSSGTPSEAQPGPGTELSCNLPCPPPHSPSLPQPLSESPSRLQGSVLTSLKSHSWTKSVLMYLPLVLPSFPASLSSDLSPCLYCQSYK